MTSTIPAIESWNLIVRPARLLSPPQFRSYACCIWTDQARLLLEYYGWSIQDRLVTVGGHCHGERVAHPWWQGRIQGGCFGCLSTPLPTQVLLVK